MSLDVFDGLMLSDGNICINPNGKNARYQQTCRERTFLEWVSRRLPTESRISGPHPIKGKDYTYYLLRSVSDQLYLNQRRRWYPEGRKIIPKDITISKSSMLAAFLGDGCMEHPKRGRSFASLATHCFSEDDLDTLMAGLLSVNILSSKKPVGGGRRGYSLMIHRDSTRDFLDFIGNCPQDLEKEYGHKWVVKYSQQVVA